MIEHIREAELLNKLREIINGGPYDLREFEGMGGSGGPGRLVEHLLGIQANNVGAPDAVEFEIKTTMDKGSLLTLFHKEPGRRHKEAMPSLVKGFGWPPIRGNHPAETLSFRQTVGCSPNERGFRVAVESRSVRVSFDANDVAPKHAAWLQEVLRRCSGKLEHPPVWTEDELSRTVSRKLANCIYVRGNRSGQSRQIVKYEGMEIFRNLLPSKLLEGIQKGSVLVDFDARTQPNGTIRNHGTKFRIRKPDFHSLYEDVQEC